MTRRARASLGQSRFQPTWTWTPQLALTRWPLASSVRRTSATWARPSAPWRTGLTISHLWPPLPLLIEPSRLGLPARGQVRHLDSALVGSDPQAVVADGAVGGDRLDLDSEGQVVGVHRCAPFWVVINPLVTVVTVAQTRRFVKLIPEAVSPNSVWTSGSIFVSERAAFIGWRDCPKNARAAREWPKKPRAVPGVGQRMGEVAPLRRGRTCPARSCGTGPRCPWRRSRG